MKNLKSGFMYAAIIVILLLSQKSTSFAQQVPAPSQLTMYLDLYQNNIANLVPVWKYDNPEVVDSFKVYMAMHQTDTLSYFSCIRSFGTYDDSLINGWYSYSKLNKFMNAGTYSFYMTAWSDSLGESSPSNIAYLNIPFHQKPTIQFTSIPDTLAHLYQPYSYAVSATISDGSTLTYSFLNHPIWMHIDSYTGEITGNYPIAGYQSVSIKACKEDDTTVYAIQSFRLYVAVYYKLAQLNGIVTYESGDTVMDGFVTLINPDDTINKSYSIINDGAFTFYLDSAIYYLYFTGSSFIPEWWQNQYSQSTANFVNLGDGQVQNIKVIVTKIPDPQYNQIIFISQPILNADANITYTYKAISNYYYYGQLDSNAKIHYSIINGPSGLNIDSITGKVNWIPTGQGIYYISIKAYLAENPYVYQLQNWNVKAFGCHAEIDGIALDQNNNNVKEGYAYFCLLRPNTYDSLLLFDSVAIQNGKFNADLDSGTYYVYFQGTHFNSVWLGNVTNMLSSTPVILKCNDVDTIQVTLNVTPYIHEYNVSGNVRIESDTTLPVQRGIVEFFSFNADGSPDSVFRTEFYNGEYSIKLTDEYTYKALAIPDNSDSNQNAASIYYDKVTDPTLASNITLTSDTQINFFCPTNSNYSNSINGTIVNDDSTAVTDIYVIAYLVQTNSQNEQSLYLGRTVYVGNDSSNTNAFKLENLIPGDYVLFTYKFDNSIVPGYYLVNDFAALNWQNATKISVSDTGNIDDIKIKVKMFQKANGDGSISGSCSIHKGVIKAEDSPQSGDEPLVGANVYLLDYNLKVVAFDQTKDLGNYNLTGLPEGIYNFIADRVSYGACTKVITITSDKPNVTNDVNLGQDITVSVYENKSQTMQISVYPNPASDIVTIVLNSNSGIMYYSLFNTYGEVIIHDSKTIETGNNTIVVDLKGIASGSYFIRLENGTESSVIPISVIK